MSRRSNFLGKKDGWVIAEFMGGMGIYLIMAAAIGVLLFFLFSGTNLSTMTQGLSTMRLQTKQLYTGSGDYVGLDTELAINTGIIPDSLVKSGGEVKNVWNGDVTIETGDDPNTFVITNELVPKESATKFATFQVGSWVDVIVNGTSVGSAENIVAAVAAVATETNTISFISN